MKIGVLTSSRADYGVYNPLLQLLSNDPFFDLHIIAFGTHLSKQHGYTIKSIIEDGHKTIHKINSFPTNDTPSGISAAMGKCITNFSRFWQDNKFDLIFALGDRYEMFAAVSSLVPFNVNVAHISGGETTAGAIDNIFRHSISLMSKLHFTSHDFYKAKLIQILGQSKYIYNVGALNIDNLKNLNLLTVEQFQAAYKIDLSKPSILITFHPETVSYSKNSFFIKELIDALTICSRYQLIITMPNADTMGNVIREKLLSFIKKNKNAIGIESFGTIGYLSCMKHCSFMLGNTSSGFVEASFFPKYVINLGERQKGRIITPNINNTSIESKSIYKAILKIEKLKPLKNLREYGNGKAAMKIIGILKKVSL